jgi:hypothetical protein
MSIKVPMPDGTIAEFPEGTSSEVIERVRQQKMRAAPRPETPGMLQTGIRAFGQGFSYGGADEAIAGAERAAGVMPYEQSLREQAEEREAMRRANPLTYGASELAGALVSPNPFGKVGAVRGALGRLGTQAGAGATTGAIQGGLEAGPDSRLAGTAVGAAAGSVAGPAFGGLMAGARGARDIFQRAVRPDEPRVASQEMLAAMREGPLTSGQMLQNIAERRPGEIQPLGLLMGQAGQGATERAAISGGAAGDVVREFSQETLAGSGGRVMNVVNEMTGGNRQFTQDILEKYNKLRNANASDLYGKARAVGYVQDDEIVNLIIGDPLLRKLYKSAQTNAARQENLKIPDLVDKDGNLIQNAYPTVAGLDYLMRAVRTKKDQAFRNQDVNASGIRALFDRLDGLTKSAVPEYGAARARFAEDSELIKLSELGQRFQNMPQSDRATALRGLTPDQVGVVRDTARDTFYNRLASMDDAGLARALTSSRQNRDLLDFLAVSPDAAAQAALRIKQERQLQEFARNINPNMGSRTARTQAAAGGGVDQLARAEQTAEFVSGGAASRLMTILNMAQGRLRGLTPAVREDMARMLVQTDPEQQAQILSRLRMEDQLLMREEMQRAQRRLQDVQFGARVPGLLSTEE